MDSLVDLQKKQVLCNHIKIIIQELKNKSSLNSYNDLISWVLGTVLKDLAEKEDGHMVIEEIYDMISILQRIVICVHQGGGTVWIARDITL